MQLLLERCAATINAGWSSREIKSQMTKAFKDAATDATLLPSHRAALADQTRRLIGMKRLLVNEVTFMADGSVQVSFSTAHVDKDDAERWIAAMQDR